MSTVVEIKAAIARLSAEEYAELMADLMDFPDDDWDRAMMADASDAIRLETEADQTGLLFSILNATSKLGYAISVGAFAVLEAIGFDPAPGAVNTPEVILGLQWLFIAAPVVLLALSALVLRIYPLTPERHAEIRARLAARDGA